MDSFSERLRNTLVVEEPQLRAVSEQAASARPGGAIESWSVKQELGHLIDSATNNRVRFVKAALEGSYTGTSYDGPGWVELGGYTEIPWVELRELWTRLNQAMVELLKHIPQHRLSAPCRVGQAEPVTLAFLIDDYILHLQHHLDHILRRERLTPYPGAAVGV